jgi:hypothetical protein
MQIVARAQFPAPYSSTSHGMEHHSTRTANTRRLCCLSAPSSRRRSRERFGLSMPLRCGKHSAVGVQQGRQSGSAAEISCAFIASTTRSCRVCASRASAIRMPDTRRSETSGFTIVKPCCCRAKAHSPRSTRATAAPAAAMRPVDQTASRTRTQYRSLHELVSCAQLAGTD